MGALRVDHPDVLEFVGAKRASGAFTNFNLSVAVTDRFMTAVVADESYELIHPRHRGPTSRLRARAVFDAIVQAAWEAGDPGLLYLDAIARANPTPSLGEIETTNPCGEVPLLPWESCVLGSVNLAHMVRGEHGTPAVDWERLRHVVRTGVRFLDDVIEVNRDPLPEIAAATRATRKIGLGVMGFAECLILLGVPYGGDEAVAWADRLIGFIADEARAASRALAEERGVFPAWPQSVHGARDDRRRNATLLSIAPTGTLGILAGTSAGIEPLYALAYRRAHTLGGAPLVETNPIFERWAVAHRLDAPALVRAVAAAGTLAAVADVPDAVRRLFVTATELDVDQHLAVQHAFQRHVDNAVSKTINLPEDAPSDAVAHAYLEGWRLGLKGVTVYRSGSRDAQVLTLGTGDDPAAREHFARCDAGACRL
jgi:ribonucleoside-diphosphate reductase alpha chain